MASFAGVLCISTSFWVLHAPKSWSKHFFQPFFNLFCSFQSFFSDFTAEINKKHLKMNKKIWFCLLLKAGRHAKDGRLPEGVPQNFLISVDFFNKSWKRLKKMFWLAFGCTQHPKADRNTQHRGLITSSIQESGILVEVKGTFVSQVWFELCLFSNYQMHKTLIETIRNWSELVLFFSRKNPWIQTVMMKKEELNVWGLMKM